MAVRLKSNGVFVGSDLRVKQNSAWASVKSGFEKRSGVWVPVYTSEVVAVLTSGINAVIKSAFDPAVWASGVAKRIIIPASVVIGSSSLDWALMITGQAEAQAASFGGSLTIDVYGIVSGRGGLASATGGNAIWVNHSGKDGQQVILNVHPGAIVRGGGGGGGSGGRGGAGQTSSSSTEGPKHESAPLPNTYWTNNTMNNTATIFWGGATIASGLAFALTTYTTGNVTYTRGTAWQSGVFTYYQISKRTTTTTNTTGGAGGAGGRGQGYDVPTALGGSTGATGGTSAGRGGTGGTGGTWGNTGNTGATGAAGNAGSGSSGSSGGLAGAYLRGSTKTTINNLGGTSLGRLLAA